MRRVVQLIENSYWGLVASIEAVKVAEKSLETAQSLLEQTQTEYEVGVKSRVEVVEAEAGVAARDLDLIRALNRELRSQDVLHSFFVPMLRLKQDAVPGMTIPIWFEVDEEQFVQAFEGQGHAKIVARLRIAGGEDRLFRPGAGGRIALEDVHGAGALGMPQRGDQRAG